MLLEENISNVPADKDYNLIRDQVIRKLRLWVIDLMDKDKNIIKSMDVKGYTTALRLSVGIIEGANEGEYVRIRCPAHPEYVDFLTKERVKRMNEHPAPRNKGKGWK